jgi:hypothetical protein
LPPDAKLFRGILDDHVRAGDPLRVFLITRRTSPAPSTTAAISFRHREPLARERRGPGLSKSIVANAPQGNGRSVFAARCAYGRRRSDALAEPSKQSTLTAISQSVIEQQAELVQVLNSTARRLFVPLKKIKKKGTLATLW